MITLRSTTVPRKWATQVIVAAAFAVSLQAGADESVGLFSGLPDNFVHSFEGVRLGAQIGALATTAAISQTGLDAGAHRSFSSGASDGWADPAIVAGYALPPLLGGALYLTSRIDGDDDLLVASFAALQASLLAVSYASVIKFVTGRPRPDGDDGGIDQKSREFHLGLDREGVVYGWPSGHTAVTAALMSSVAAYYDSPALWCVAGLTTAYVGVGMTAATGGTQHWLSDTLAGALIGYSIGSSVGSGFRQRSSAASGQAKAQVTLLPVYAGAGVQLSISLD